MATIVHVVLGIKGIDAKREGQVAQRQIGEWILQHYGTEEEVFTYREKVPYYACGHWRNIAYETSEQGFWESVEKEPRAFLVFYSHLASLDPIPVNVEAAPIPLRKVGELPEPFSKRRSIEIWLWERTPKPIPPIDLPKK